MPTDQWAHRLAPWKWAPLIVVLGLSLKLGLFWITGAYLVIPIAVYLANRYG